jgi:hydrogenase expression/formation protein HypE
MAAPAAAGGGAVSAEPPRRAGPLSRVEAKTITLAHGGGGKAMKDLIDDVFVRAFDNPVLAPLEDQARLALTGFIGFGDRIALTTDSYVVDPLFFSGGDIGRLEACGTVNDLAVGGALPLYLSCAVIAEEGLPVEVLRRVARSMAVAAHEAWVVIATGDTKIVPKGACDKLFVTTSGIGVIRRGLELGVHRAQPGDAVLVNGRLGDHGAAILAARGDLVLESPIASDCAPLHRLIAALLEAAPQTHCLRDATRGGAATVLNEFAQGSGVAIEIDDALIPMHEAVRGFCEILGLDPLYLANEGKIIAVVPTDQCDAALAAMRRDPLGRDAAVMSDHGRRTRSGHHADGLRRPAHRRHASRRTVAADLLRFKEVSLRAKRSNLAPLNAPPIEIASSLCSSQ